MTRHLPVRILLAVALVLGALATIDVVTAEPAAAQTCNNGGITGSTGVGHVGVPGCNAPGSNGGGSYPPPTGGTKPAGATWCVQILGRAFWGYTFTSDGSDCQPRPNYNNDPGACVIAQHIFLDGEIIWDASRYAPWPWGLPNCLGSYNFTVTDLLECGRSGYLQVGLSTAADWSTITLSDSAYVSRPWAGDDCSSPRSSRTDFPGGELWGPLPTAIEANITTPEAAHVGGELRPNRIAANTGRLMCGTVPCPTAGSNAPRIDNIAYDLRIDASPTYLECAIAGQSGCDYFLRYTRDSGTTGGPVTAELLAYAATRPNESVNVSVKLRQGTAIQRGTLTAGGYTTCTWRVRGSGGGELPGSRNCQTVHHGTDQALSRIVPITVFGDTDGSFPVVSATNRIR